MDGSGQHEEKQRTLAAQPAAAAHAGVHVAVAVGLRGLTDAQRTEASGPPRTRLERILLAARQMQQH